MSKEELAAPDEIEIALNKVWDALTKYKLFILGGLAGLLAIGVLMVVVNASSNSAREGRSAELRAALAPIGAPTGDEDPAAKELPGPKPERFADRAAMLAAAAERLAAYASAHEGDDALELIDITRADVLLAQGDAAGALTLIERWLTTYQGSPAQPAALDVKARALAASGKASEAIETYEAVAKGATGKLKAVALKRAGDLANPALVDGGDAAKAKQAYEAALEALGPDPGADDASAAIVGKPGLRGELDTRLALLP